MNMFGRFIIKYCGRYTHEGINTATRNDRSSGKSVAYTAVKDGFGTTHGKYLHLSYRVSMFPPTYEGILIFKKFPPLYTLLLIFTPLS